MSVTANAVFKRPPLQVTTLLSNIKLGEEFKLTWHHDIVLTRLRHPSLTPDCKASHIWVVVVACNVGTEFDDYALGSAIRLKSDTLVVRLKSISKGKYEVTLA